MIHEPDHDTSNLLAFPRCGHCKKLKPELEKAAEALQRKGVTVANMDATANDLPPGVMTQGYPTLKVLDVASLCIFVVCS